MPAGKVKREQPIPQDATPFTEPAQQEPSPGQISGDGLILTVAILSGILPFLLFASVKWWFTWDHQQPSQSEYIYTSAQPFFVGIVFALGLVLVFYRGYPENHGPIPLSDAKLANITGAGAIFTAVLPSNTCTAQYGELINAFHSLYWGYFHLASAAVAFSGTAIFLLFYFTQSNEAELANCPPSKRIRNRIYQICGIIVVACLLYLLGRKIWAWATGAPDCAIVNQISEVFIAESIILVAISIGWLTKFLGRKFDH